MHRVSLWRTYIAFAVMSSAVAALSQESAPGDTGSDRDRNETADQSAVLETCATVPGATDISVLDDRHVYIRTRGSNHYLLTTEECDNLLSSFVRREVRLLPYGRHVCQSDGSYLLYVDRGRERACYVERVQRVENRDEAHELAAGPSPAVTVEPIEIDQNPDASDSQDENVPR